MSAKEKIQELRITVLRDKCAEQSEAFDKMQNKMFALITLLLTLGGLLTYDAFRINLPNTVLEYIIFVAALVGLGITATLIGYDYRTKKTWSIAIGPAEEVKLDNAASYIDALDIIHADYLIVYADRDKVLDKKAKFLNTSLHTLVISVILLIVLKIGG